MDTHPYTCKHTLVLTNIHELTGAHTNRHICTNTDMHIHTHISSDTYTLILTHTHNTPTYTQTQYTHNTHNTPTHKCVCTHIWEKAMTPHSSTGDESGDAVNHVTLR